MTDSKIKLRQSSTFNSPLQGLNFQFCWRPLGRAFVKGNPIYFPEELVGSVMRVSRIMRIIPSSSRIDRVSAFVHLGPRLKSEWYFDLLFTKVSYHQTEFPWECKRSKCRWKQRYSIDWGTSCLPYIFLQAWGYTMENMAAGQTAIASVSRRSKIDWMDKTTQDYSKRLWKVWSLEKAAGAILSFAAFCH